MKLKISREAKKLIDKGFEGNGCGSGFISRTLCWLAQRFLKINLEEVWRYHDAEYSVPESKKSTEHKAQADYYAHLNINALANIDKNATGYKVRFARIVHALLVLEGHRAYWRK